MLHWWHLSLPLFFFSEPHQELKMYVHSHKHPYVQVLYVRSSFYPCIGLGGMAFFSLTLCLTLRLFHIFILNYFSLLLTTNYTFESFFLLSKHFLNITSGCMDSCRSDIPWSGCVLNHRQLYSTLSY